MSRVAGTIQNFINGVSEQPPAVRLPTQVEGQINAYSTIVRGLVKRFPSQHIAKLSGFEPASSYLHTINRDTTERYEVAFRTDGIDVVSLVDGASKTVNFATFTITSLDEVEATADGVSKRVYTATGDTNLNVITTGTFVGTVQLEESATGAFAGEETNNGAGITTATTSARTITSGYYYRLTCSAYTSGTITGTMDWKDTGYLQGTPSTDYEALTVADYTFLTNKSVTVASDANVLSSSNGPEALVHIVRGAYSRWYRVYIDGTQVANYQAPALNQTTTANSYLAEEAMSMEYIQTAMWNGTLGGALPSVNGDTTKDFVSNLTTGFTAVRVADNCFHIVKDDGTDFTCTVETDTDVDSTILRAHKGAVTKFSDLPREAPQGFQIKVKGDADTNFDDYYVEFEFDDVNDSAGRWNEKVAPGIEIWLDKTTMPHTLVRESDGTFTFGAATYLARDAGDLTTSPWPSFKGTTIDNISFFKNRLIFTGSENVVSSRAGEFFDFFRETITTVLDTDPVDIAISYRDVSVITHVVPQEETIILFAGHDQFILKGSSNDDLFTPKTVSINHIRDYRSDPNVTPVTIGPSIFFAVDGRDATQVRELIIDRQGASVEAPSVTAHVPGYLPLNFTKIVGSSDGSALVGMSSTHTDRLYVYKFFISGNEKLQSSWSYFTFDHTIMDIEFVDDDLIVIFDDGTDIYIDQLPFNEDFVDSGDIYVCLDHRVHTDDLAAGSYAAGPDETTYTLPYDASGVVCVTDANHTLGIGVNVVVNDDTSTTTVVVAGDQTAETLYFGFTYDSTVTLSEFVSKKSGPGGAETPFVAGELTVLSLDLLMGQSGYLTAEVTQAYRDTFTHTFTGAAIGAAANLAGQPALEWDNWYIPVNSAAKETTITLKSTSSYLQFALLNAEWRGRLYRRGI